MITIDFFRLLALVESQKYRFSSISGFLSSGMNRELPLKTEFDEFGREETGELRQMETTLQIGRREAVDLTSSHTHLIVAEKQPKVNFQTLATTSDATSELFVRGLGIVMKILKLLSAGKVHHGFWTSMISYSVEKFLGERKWFLNVMHCNIFSFLHLVTESKGVHWNRLMRNFLSCPKFAFLTSSETLVVYSSDFNSCDKAILIRFTKSKWRSK